MADKNVHVTLTADVSQYIKAMNKAARATRRAQHISIAEHYFGPRAHAFVVGAVVGAAISTVTLLLTLH